MAKTDSRTELLLKLADNVHQARQNLEAKQDEAEQAEQEYSTAVEALITVAERSTFWNVMFQHKD